MSVAVLFDNLITNLVMERREWEKFLRDHVRLVYTQVSLFKQLYHKLCVFSYKLLQVNTGQLVFSEYDVYITEPLFKTPEEFSRHVIFTFIPCLIIIFLPFSNRFYRATQDLHSLVAAIDDKEDGQKILTLITHVAAEFRQELNSEYEIHLLLMVHRYI